MAKKRRAKKNAPPKPSAPKPESVVVGYLSGGETTLAFTRSLNELTAYMLTSAMADPGFPRLVGALPKQSGPRIAEGRNSLVRHFLTLGADWLLMLDDDMTFAPDALDRLLRGAHPVDRPIMGGLCFGGGRDGWFPTLYQLSPDVGSLIRLESWEQGLLPVDATGGACLLIHRSVFERLAGSYEPPWEWFQETRLGDKSTGEDITFCLRARAAGFPIFVNTEVEFGHMKLVEVDRKFFEDWRRSHRFVVTGTGRSGTGFVSKVLSTAGVPCHHEKVFTPAGEDWGWRRGDSSWLAVPFLDGFDGFVLHVLRDPLAVVNSMVGILFFEDELPDDVALLIGPYQAFAREHAPEVFELGDPVERAVAWWVVWNERVAPFADAWVRVEDLVGSDLVALARAAGGFHSDVDLQAALERVPGDVNSRRSAGLGWGDLPEGEWLNRMRVLAVEYGYKISDD